MYKSFILCIAFMLVGCTASFDEEKGVIIEEPLQEAIVSDQEENNEIEGGEEVTEDESLEVFYKINETTYAIEPVKEGVNEKVVLLTIDDAPDQFAVEMAEILYDLNVGGIFFVNGHFLKDEKGKNQLKHLHELGFEIGNHTMTHPNLSERTEEEQRNEIIKLNDLIEETLGERPRFFRSPFGVNTEVSEQVVREEGMQSMNWTYGYDFEKEYMNADALADIMVNTPLLVNGANLLMHDREFTKEALPRIVQGLQDKGYEIVNPKQIQ